MDAEMDNIFTTRSEREHSKRNWLAMSLLGLVILTVGVFAGSAITAKGWMPFKSLSGGGGGQVPIYVAADQRVNGQVALNSGFSTVAKAVTPAVVTINVSSRIKAQSPLMDPFHDFFNGPDDDDSTPRRRAPQGRDARPGPLRPSGLGSGVIVSPDGYILTNNHVVEDADKVEVRLTDGREFKATVVGTDPPSDLAVLKIDSTGLPTLPLGDSEKAEIGDIVLAVGNPLGVGQTVTMGIISAKGRTTASRGSGDYQDFIQTDAPINRGNSGGALVNLNGELIGVPSQIYSATGGSIGIGFAIPAKMARSVMDQLIRNGKVRRGRLGVSLDTRPLSMELAEQFGYKSTRGALVTEVQPGSPAEKAGVKRDDIVTEYQGQRIEDGDQLRNMVSQTTPGSTVKLKVWRDNSERELSATLAEIRQEDLAAAPPPSGGNSESEASSSALTGVRVENLTAEIARARNLPPGTRGVFVAEVEPDSAAYEAGLRPGMLIEEVGRQAVTNVTEFNQAMKKPGSSKNVLLRVRTQVGSRLLLIKPQE